NLNPTPASVIAARMLYSVDVFIDTFFTEDGKLVPVLKIEWKVATDASIIYLRGAELAVVQLSNNQQICAQFDFQNNLTFQWNFSFNRFEVQPGQMYQVTVYHLPKLSTPGDYNRRSNCYNNLFSFFHQIQPLFPACATDCPRRSFLIQCPSADALTVSIILLFLYIYLSDFPDTFLTSPMLQPPPPLKPRTVWIVYSADHKLYVDIVLKFAQFMITVCGTEVILDLLDEQQISEMGAVCWLTRQKQKMEALSSKIIILCSRGTRAKWQAMLGHQESSVHLKQDNLLPTGDMFTPALNLILPDFKQPACFGLYLICYFEGISNESDIPDPFHVTSKYQLMDKFEEIYFLIQDLEKFEPGRMHQIPAISPEKYTESPCGKQLKEALQKFQTWQAEHPDWFKNERVCGEDEDDLQSLSGELTEELIFPGKGILKKQLLPKEPDPSSCCLVNLLVNEDDLGAYKLTPQHLSEEDLAFQTLVIPAETPSVQVVKPTALAEENEILSHKLLTNEDWLESVPMIEANVPRRNDVILQGDLSSDPQALPADVRQQLEGLMYSLYQQSVIPSDMPLCQEEVNEQQQLLFDEASKVQRQSVQSDQGYISRCSSLPSDSPVELREEENQEQEGYWSAGHLTADVLSSLKSLQQQLLFQDIQKNC
uniref:Interleukin 17 receptor A n=1 Tax=Pseudonaja textilis TaxID=8673 RepID=A0A670Y5K3_PSETE